MIHETARDAGYLIVLDTYERAKKFCEENEVVFFSHQWLSWSEPDPKGVHYRAMVEAAELLIKSEDFYVWVDFTSIPQRNRVLQQLAINTIVVYASLPKHFV